MGSKAGDIFAILWWWYYQSICYCRRIGGYEDGLCGFHILMETKKIFEGGVGVIFYSQVRWIGLAMTMFCVCVQVLSV